MIKFFMAFIFSLIMTVSALATAPLDPVNKVVLIMMDDAGDNDVLERMPKTMSLLNKGVRFKQSMTEFPLCGPSRATHLSGWATHNHGVICNEEPPEGWEAWVNTGMVPALLRDAGIKTNVIGAKIINQFDGLPDLFGYQKYEVLTDHSGDKRYFNIETINEHGTLRTPPGYSTDYFKTKSLEFMRANRDNRYFLHINIAAPHAPALTAQRYENGCKDQNGNDIKAPRDAFNPSDSLMVDQPPYEKNLPIWDENKVNKVDKSFADKCRSNLPTDDLIDEIVREDPDALVILTSDNGFTYAKRYTGKAKADDLDSVKVPLVIFNAPRQDRNFNHIVVNIDIPATLLDLFNVAPAHPMDGMSLRPFLVNESVGSWRVGFGLNGIVGINEDSESTEGGSEQECFVTNDWWYCKAFDGDYHGVRVFYDRQATPYLLGNKINDPDLADEIITMRNAAQDWQECKGAECHVYSSDLRKKKRN